MPTHRQIQHSRFQRVQCEVFTLRLSPDCMKHECHMVADNERKLDACCQYGVDVDLGERDGILGHAQQLKSVLNNDVRELPWFDSEIRDDKDFPSGKFVRTKTHQGGCLFLQHDKRGCAIHRASVEGDWDFHGIKPHVCRLFPMSYDDEAIVMSDDYSDYSCAFEPNTPTVYQVGRPDLLAIFGEELVVCMDEVEKSVLAEHGKSLRILR